MWTFKRFIQPCPGNVATALLAKATVALAMLGLLAMVSVTYASEDYLEPGAAFRFSAKMIDAKTAEVTYKIADGYYMYRERFAFRANGAKLGEPIFPEGKVKFDETFQKEVETYRHQVSIRIPVEAAGPFTLTSTGQGCADKGLCYPPMESSATLNPSGSAVLATVGIAQQATDPARDAPLMTAAPSAQSDSDMGRLEASLKSGRLLAIAPLFFLLGLGLAFTPCVLPMVPIISFIIVGEGAKASRIRGLALSGTYSLGMALVYTALGIAAGLIGEGLSAALQNPWVLSTFAVLIVLLSLSMFGVYQLQLPASLQTKMTEASGKQSSGKLFGVFVMGAISALIVGPCVAAPLAAALLYISQTHDVMVGGGALFAMAAGMSVPLLLVGVSAGSLLPRAGAWMEGVKRFFGVLMLGLALWIVSPIIPGWAQMAAWAALGLGYGAYLLTIRRAGWASVAFGLLVMILGLVQLVGLATGGRDALAPLAHMTNRNSEKAEFRRVKSLAELDAAIAQAKGKNVMLDFYADWCVSCKEMEKFTFADPRIQAQFADMLLLQADVTANNDDDKALLKRFRLFGPPGILFFDREGREIEGARVIGYQNADKFLNSLQRATGS
ncbi:protein-disulfide reductase DsbD [Noviherbaspirillum massiliense]|uniref:protein-disulfide reductase DsbD n=1 Tax=Noviherbaspirillum massiliense TaxID=1465823 RepID=UPI0002E58228